MNFKVQYTNDKYSFVIPISVEQESIHKNYIVKTSFMGGARKWTVLVKLINPPTHHHQGKA